MRDFVAAVLRQTSLPPAHSEVLQKKALRLFHGFGGSHGVEESFNSCRRVEDNRGVLSIDKTWTAPINGNIIKELNQYNEVDWRASRCPPVAPARPPKMFYSPPKRSCSLMDVGSVVGTGSPGWPSLKAENLSAPVFDMVGMRGVCLAEEFAELDKSWRGALLIAGLVCRRNRLGRGRVALFSGQGARQLVCYFLASGVNPRK